MSKIIPYIMSLSTAELRNYVAKHLRLIGSFDIPRDKLLAIAQSIYNQRIENDRT